MNTSLGTCRPAIPAAAAEEENSIKLELLHTFFSFSGGNANPSREQREEAQSRVRRVTYGSTAARPRPARSQGCRHS